MQCLCLLFALQCGKLTLLGLDSGRVVSVTTHIADHRRLNRRRRIAVSVIRQRRFNTVTGDTATEI